MDYFVITVAILAVLKTTQARPDGAPLSACDSMTPGHGGSAQTMNHPYTITTSTRIYAGDDINVRIIGSETETFRGFLCQFRSQNNTALGSFDVGNSIDAKTSCSAAAVTHTSRDNKISIDFTWDSPDEDMGKIKLVCSIVKEFATYWVKIEAATLTFLQFDDVGNGSQRLHNAAIYCIVSPLIFVIIKGLFSS